jgi:DNA-nicking Smr family endonuclease
MAKKRPPKKEEESLPKFGGFKPLAGLQDFKAKLVEEEEAKKKKSAEKSANKPAPPPRTTAAMRERDREAARSSPDDDLSFHRLMAGVVPLGETGKSRVPVSTPKPSGSPRLKAAELQARAAAETEQVLSHLSTLVDEPVRFEVSDDGKHVEGRRADVPPALLRAVRRGQLPIDARLDLHGLTADAARERLADFLREKRTRGERCVLVIHGKGIHSDAGGVLRGEIAAWLSQGRAREHVAAFATARAEDGGEGAVYVALRR